MSNLQGFLVLVFFSFFFFPRVLHSSRRIKYSFTVSGKLHSRRAWCWHTEQCCGRAPPAATARVCSFVQNLQHFPKGKLYPSCPRLQISLCSHLWGDVNAGGFSCCCAECFLKERGELASAANITVQALCLFTCDKVSTLVCYQFFLPFWNREPWLRLDCGCLEARQAMLIHSALLQTTEWQLTQFSSLLPLSVVLTALHFAFNHKQNTK